MSRIRWTREARQSPREIGSYIAQQSGSLEVAERLLDRIDIKATQYDRSPLLGELRDDLAPAVRCFRVGRYVEFYRADPEGILILLVIHSSRDVPAVFRQAFGSTND